MICKNQSSHSFNNGNGPGQYTWVVSPNTFQQYFFTLVIDRLLGL
jgi:hypothetical protein